MRTIEKFSFQSFTYNYNTAEEKLEIINENFIKCEKINLFNFFLYICDILNAHEMYVPFLSKFAEIYQKIDILEIYIAVCCIIIKKIIQLNNFKK